MLRVIRQEKTVKRGAKCKRLLCALNPDYLLKALEALPNQQTIECGRPAFQSLAVD